QRDDRVGRRGEEREGGARGGRPLHEGARRRRGRRDDPRAGGVHDARGDRVRAGVGAARDRGVNENIVSELRSRARDVLITQAIVSEEVIDQAEPAQDLLEVEGMDRELAYVLASRGIVTREDLAEQAVDDLEGIENLDADKAAKLIMAARAHWFEGEQQTSTAEER